MNEKRHSLDIEPGLIVETDVQKDPDGKNSTFVEILRYKLQFGRRFVPNFSGPNLRPNDRMNFFYS